MMRSIPSSRARRAASVPRIPQSTDTMTSTFVGVQPIDGGRLEPVAVAQAFGDEVHHLAAEHLERAPEDDGRGDAVDVVVAVDGDPFAARQRPLEPRHGAVHVGEQKRIVEMVERRDSGSDRPPPGRSGPRRHSRRATVGWTFRARRERRRVVVVARQVLPQERSSSRARSFTSLALPRASLTSTKACPSRPMRRNLS